MIYAQVKSIQELLRIKTIPKRINQSHPRKVSHSHSFLQKNDRFVVIRYAICIQYEYMTRLVLGTDITNNSCSI